MTLVKFRNGGGTSFPSFESRFAFPSFFSDTFDKFLTEEEMSWMPAVNVTERAGDYKIDLAAPGMDKKDFSVEVENGVLTVSGERKEEIRNETDKTSRREFHYGTFKRSFNLPETANAENVQASYKDGMLTLLVSKQEDTAQKSKKQIEIK